jgi:4-hydroxy-2-oxoglutarate aldolase
MLLEGLYIPLTTPFRRDGNVDHDALAANVRRYSLTPAAGLIVLGPTAEPTLLDENETREVLRVGAVAATREKVLIAGIARDSVYGALELAKCAAEYSYDATLVGIPTLPGGLRPLELLTFFRAIADGSPLPMILLSTAERPLSAEAIAQLSSHANIVGLLAAHAVGEMVSGAAAIKREVAVTHVFTAVTKRMLRSSGTGLISPAGLGVAVADAAPVLRTRTKTVGFQVIAARSEELLDALESGAVGIAPAFAAAAPQACYEIYAAWKDEDHALAAEKQQRITEAANLTETLGPGGLKFAADLNGYAGGFPRLPHLPPSGNQRAWLEGSIKPLHN